MEKKNLFWGKQTDETNSLRQVRRQQQLRPPAGGRLRPTPSLYREPWRDCKLGLLQHVGSFRGVGKAARIWGHGVITEITAVYLASLNLVKVAQWNKKVDKQGREERLWVAPLSRVKIELSARMAWSSGGFNWEGRVAFVWQPLGRSVKDTRRSACLYSLHAVRSSSNWAGPAQRQFITLRHPSRKWTCTHPANSRPTLVACLHSHSLINQPNVSAK